MTEVRIQKFPFKIEIQITAMCLQHQIYMYIYGPFSTCMFVEKLSYVAVKGLHLKVTILSLLMIYLFYDSFLAAKASENHLLFSYKF